MRNQGNNQPEIQHTTDKVVSDKKARRQARKQEIKAEKKQRKQQKREQHMDVEESDWELSYILLKFPECTSN